jgi:hypothetical protein
MEFTAPVEYLLISFPGNRFNGDIAPAIADLVAKGTVHIIDLVFVKKDADGTVEAFEYEDLEEAAGFLDIDGEAEGLLSPEDIEAAAEALEPDSSALFIVWEDLWAADLATAIWASGGQMVAGERIPREVVQAALLSAESNEEDAS